MSVRRQLEGKHPARLRPTARIWAQAQDTCRRRQRQRDNAQRNEEPDIRAGLLNRRCKELGTDFLSRIMVEKKYLLSFLKAIIQIMPISFKYKETNYSNCS